MSGRNYKFKKIISLLQQLTHSNSVDAEILYSESKGLLSFSLDERLFEVISNPAKFEEEDEFLNDIIRDLKDEIL